jgi:hypothetical protein
MRLILATTIGMTGMLKKDSTITILKVAHFREFAAAGAKLATLGYFMKRAHHPLWKRQLPGIAFRVVAHAIN